MTSVRVMIACDACRARKSRCPAGQPCKSCETRNIDCIYKKVEPSKKELAIEEIKRSTNEFLKSLEEKDLAIIEIKQSLANMQAELALLQGKQDAQCQSMLQEWYIDLRYLHGIAPVKDEIALRSYCKQVEDGHKPFPKGQSIAIHHSVLKQLVNAYLTDVHDHHPILKDPDQIFQLSVTQNCDSITDITVLLMLALGEACMLKVSQDVCDEITANESQRGIGYFLEAHKLRIWQQSCDDLEHIGFILLTSIYLQKCGRVYESQTTLKTISGIVDLLECTNTQDNTKYDAAAMCASYNMLVNDAHDCFWEPHRNFKLAEGVFRNLLGFHNSGFWCRSVFKAYVQALHHSIHGYRGFPVGHGPDQMLECAKYIIGIFSDLRARLPCSAWTDMEIPSTNMNEAMMRADYHHLQFTVLLPYLFFACHRAQFPESGAWSAKQTELAKVAITCVNSGFLSIIAFDRVGADPKRAYSTAREVYDVVPTHLNPVKHSNNLLRTALVFTAFRKSQLFLQIGGQTLFSVVPLDNLMQKIAKEIQLVARISPLAKLYIDILYNVMHQG